MTRDPAEYTQSVSATPREPRDTGRKLVEQHQLEERLEEGHRKIHVFVSTIGGLGPGVLSTVSDRPVYAIIGTGFCGTVNHATLLQAPEALKQRLQQLPVSYVGFPDPWLGYVDHEMNQEREIMILPGFENQVTAPSRVRRVPFVRSTDFVLATARERTRLKEASSPAPEREPWHVKKIEKAGENYKIYSVEGKVITAARIDICTGPGASRFLKSRTSPSDKRGIDPNRGINMSSDLEDEYMAPPGLGATPKVSRVIAASQFTQGNVLTTDGGWFLVIGAGPAAAQAVEHALGWDEDPGQHASAALWVASEAVNRAFIPNTRVDGLAKMVTGEGPKDLPEVRLEPISAKLVPARDGLCFGEKYRPVALETLTTDRAQKVSKEGFKYTNGQPIERLADQNKILVTFEKLAADSRFADHEGDVSLPLQYGVFDQIVISAALQNLAEEPGSAFSLVDPMWQQWARQQGHTTNVTPEQARTIDTSERTLEAAGISFEPLLPLTTGSYMFNPVGLKSSDGKIRILGAAGLSSDMMRFLCSSDQYEDLTLYHNSLPAQARVFYQGVTLSAVTTAHANGFFDRWTNGFNRNLNTATRMELCNLAGDKLGDVIYYLRNLRIRPFHNLEQLKNLMAYYLEHVQPVYDSFLTALTKTEQELDPQKKSAWKAAEFEGVVVFVNSSEKKIAEGARLLREKHSITLNPLDQAGLLFHYPVGVYPTR